MFKLMLACNKPVDPNEITYPVLATPKLDGVRAAMLDGQCKQRSLKPVKNKFIQEQLKDLRDGPDGELTVGLNFHKSSGDIRRETGEPDFTYWVFDDTTDPTAPYEDRIAGLADITHPRVKIVLPILCNNAEELNALVTKWVAEGYEGGITRKPGSPYKCGRATRKQEWMLKIKEFIDEEATILSCYEMMHNANEAKTNLLGRTERSSHKENLVPTGKLGGFWLSSPNWLDFKCGSMLDVTHEERRALWERRDELPGELVKFKYQPHGSVDRPRIPIFLGFRDKDDL